MPGLNGLQAAAQIKRFLPDIRVLLLSGHILDAPYSEYKAQGFNFVILTKPIHPETLLNVLREKSTLEQCRGDASRILAVDDVEAHRNSLNRLLQRAGFSFIEAKTGAEAIKYSLEEQPDLILLDVNLPDENSYDVAKQLRANPATSGITIVHLTASDLSPQAKSRSLDAGTDEFLTQPIEPSALVKTLRSLLKLKYLREAAAD